MKCVALVALSALLVTSTLGATPPGSWVWGNEAWRVEPSFLRLNVSAQQRATTQLKLKPGSFSFAAFIRPYQYPEAGGSKSLWIMDNGGGGDGCAEAVLFLNSSGYLQSSRWSTGSSNCQSEGIVKNPTTPDPLPLQQWIHVVAVFTDSKSLLYLNGNLVSAENYLSYPLQSVNWGFNFGDGRSGMQGGFASGAVDIEYMQIWAKELSSSDIMHLFSSPPDTQIGSSSLVGYWRCSAHNTSRLTDLAEGKWHGEFARGAQCLYPH
jgi:hypothetical protein